MVDYALIRAILEELREAYPKARRASELVSFHHTEDKEKFTKTLYYLKEHALLAFPSHQYLGGETSIGRIAVTAKGIDFLESDGGISALAGPVVRIAPESLTAIIDVALEARKISEKDRSAIRNILAVAGTETIKTVTQRLISAGLAQAQDVLSLFKA